MKLTFLLAFLVLTSLWWPFETHKPNNAPKHVDFEFSMDVVKTSEQVFEFYNPDSVISHQMNLLRDTNGLALCYYSDIQTPVCIDGICKPVRIEMYWNLLGNYIGYGVYPQELLSKYDHEIFEEKDYLKLHLLLKDKHSILERKDMSSLYDLDETRKDTITFNGEVVDGVTGATKKEIKNSIVEGALYSCYKLWHIAHGEASQKAKLNISQIYNDELEEAFLDYDQSAYQMFALKQLDSLSMIQKISRITPLIAKVDPLQRSYILKKIPTSLLKDPSLIHELYGDISALDINSKTLLIKRSVNSSPLAFDLITRQLQFLSKNQVKMLLKILSENERFLNGAVLKNIKSATERSEFAFSYLVKEFLQGR